MIRTLGLFIIGLLLMPSLSFGADVPLTPAQTITNKAKSALSPVKNNKVINAGKKFNTSGSTSGNSGSTTTPAPETTTIAIESPTLIQDPNTCAYTWTIRIRNTGTAPIPDGALTLVAQPMKADHSNAGPAKTVQLRDIQPGAFYPVSSSFTEKPAEAISLLMGIQKGTENLGSVNYPFPSVAASCNQSQ